jgi:hypothetical protein
MRRTVKIGLATTMMLALASVSAFAVETTKVDTKVVIEGYNYNGATDTVKFSGHVKADGKCEADRKITLRQTTDGIKAGTGTTDADGDWQVKFKGSDVNGGEFKAIASQLTITKKRHGEVVKKTVCKAGSGKYSTIN